MARLISVVIMIVLMGSTVANGIGVTQSLEPPDIAFDGQAEFEIKISWAGSQRDYYFPNPLRPILERLRVGKFSSSISSVGTGTDEITTKTYTYTLIPFLSGQGRVDAVAIDYISLLDSIPGQLLTEPMALIIAEPVAIEIDDDSWFGLTLIIVSVLLFGTVGLLYWLLIVRGRPKSEKKLSPIESFLVGLDITRAESGDDLKKFQTGLYSYLRAYLTEQFDIAQSIDRTDDIIKELEKTSLTREQRDTIGGWLARAEKEKYSPVKAAPGATTRLAAEVREYFEKNLS